jgi:class 3 adenylate cyclase
MGCHQGGARRWQAKVGSLARLPSNSETQRVKAPEVSYARSGDVAIAYQVVGSGPPDIVFVRGLAGDLLSTWEQPLLVRLISALGSIGRVLMLDKRGSGLSDRLRDVPSVEASMDDIRAVMDDAGSERAVVFTGSSATGVGVLFAATYPERCAGLVLVDPRARGSRAPDYPWAPSPEEGREQLKRIRAQWGERGYLEDMARELAPEIAGDDEFRDWFVWHMRRSLSPGAALTAQRSSLELDVTDVLAAVRVPTLTFPRASLPGPGHFVASRIADAEIALLPTFRGVYTWVDDESHAGFMDAFSRFIERLSGSSEHERVLATLLFTDIVGSTELVARLGDTAWGSLLQRHHAIVRSQLSRFRGREVDTSGDGFFAAFDGPARAVRAAIAIRDALAQLDLHVRAGLHTGECEIHDGKVAGIAVNVAARVSGLAETGEVLVSSTVKDLLAGSGIEFDDRGEHVLKGLPEPWRLYAAQGSAAGSRSPD